METRTCQKLHEEHLAVVELLRRFQIALSGAPPGSAPDFSDATWSALLRDLRAGLEHEVAPHFEFEENFLFAILEQNGEGDLVALLSADHVAIRAQIAPLLGLIGRARDGGLDASGWRSLRQLGLELCADLSDHAMKEEQAMLPALEGALSATDDGVLIAGYVGDPGLAVPR